MASLYVDTSNKLFLGLLDHQFSLIEVFKSEEKKNSAQLHKVIFDLLEKNSLEASEIEALFIAAGPGSYTGVRLGEGLGQILDWQEIPVYSFYHFDVPKILGKDAGIWLSQAFKGEIFYYEWDEKSNSRNLKKLNDFLEYLKNKKGITLFGIADFECPELEDIENTITMIEKNSRVFFKHIYDKKMRKEPYYYRPDDVEFKPTQKG